MELSEKQIQVITYFEMGYNIFLSGAGGSGKSHLIRYLNLLCKKKRLNVQVCALTGCAALLLNCNAKTVHSWAGIGLGTKNESELIKNIINTSWLYKRWKKIDCLIIDEVSMLSKQLFDMLNRIAKAVREDSREFGGIQIVLSGDFYQLSPVGRHDIEDTYKFCFESEKWDDVIDKTVVLDKIFRQNDKKYVKILSEIRKGKLSEKNKCILEKRMNIDTSELYIKPIKIFPTKEKVNKLNKMELKKLDGKMYNYEYKIVKPNKSNFSEKQIDMEIDYLVRNSLFDEILELKKNTQVMCIRNLDLDNGICNGSLGVIVDFVNNNPIVKFSNGVKMQIPKISWESEKIDGLYVEQIPLIMGWGLTIHKIQGATLDMAEIDIGNDIFTNGQSYVALSRVKSLEGLYLSYMNKDKIKCNKKVKSFYNKLLKTL